MTEKAISDQLLIGRYHRFRLWGSQSWLQPHFMRRILKAES